MLILASNSPRRKQLVSLGGWNYSVLAPHVDERVCRNEIPEDYVIRLAKEKAAAASNILSKRDDVFFKNDVLILAADTAVIEQDEKGDWTVTLGKPIHADEAVRMLQRLKGKTHRVVTGLAVLRVSDQFCISRTVSSEVTMREYNLDEIRAYIETGDPFDKAGAYAIQNATFQPVQFLQGCYANVMGLPVCEAAEMLTVMGYPPNNEVASECQRSILVPCNISQQFLKTSLQHLG